MFFTIWVVFHVIVCAGLVLVVLLQSAKGEGLAGSAFGGGGGGMGSAVFGGRGAASFLSKATTVLAIVFMVNCGVLAFMSSSTRTTADYSETGESAVTRQAQQEMEMQRQAQAQQQLVDTTQQAGDVSLDELMQQADQPADTSGGN